MLKKSKALERLARNFICGNKIEAINRARKLKEDGIYSTINNVVEHVDGYALAGSATMAACDLLFSIRQWDLIEYTSISIKMSALGMDFDKDCCEENILQITRLGDHLGIIVQFDVEDPETHQFYYDMVHKHSLNGAIQAKSPPILLPSKPPRIVKGAYKPRIRKSKTYQREQIVDWVRKYMRWSDEKVIVGTHDQFLIDWLAANHDKDRIELQYLRGVKEEEFRKYKEMGFKVREYIPYGDNWYPYVMRRIKEDPWGRLKIILSV